MLRVHAFEPHTFSHTFPPPTPTHPQVRQMVEDSEPDPNMYGALPPGAWWEIANGVRPPPPRCSQQQQDSSDLAVQAARSGAYLELRDVSFAYPVRSEVQVLRDLNLRLPKGKVTAVVGRSGAGKSTVANLLARWVMGWVIGRVAGNSTVGCWPV